MANILVCVKQVYRVVVVNMAYYRPVQVEWGACVWFAGEPSCLYYAGQEGTFSPRGKKVLCPWSGSMTCLRHARCLSVTECGTLGQDNQAQC